MAMFPQKYEHERRLYANFSFPKSKDFSTKPFLPLPGNLAIFRFDASYEIEDSIPAVSLFKLSLVVVSSASPPLQVWVDVKVYHSDGSLLVEYPKMHCKNVDVTERIIFIDVIRPLTDRSGHHSEHDYKMASKSIILKCTMTFSGEHFTPIDEMKSSKRLDLIENLKSVYEPSVLSDITLKVGDRSFPAHKVILAAHSPVFMKKFLESKTNTVTITDTTPEILDLFLKFLYSGEIGDKSLDSLQELYSLADKYDVGFLKKECTFAVTSVLTVDSICEILIWAYRYSDSDLKNAATNFAVNHIKELILRDDWKELVENQPLIGYNVTANFILK